jgi:pyruvate formate lyase activating enzyme
MKIGGLQKNSLIDYPGKLSCVVFLAGCNFACPYCHNPGLVPNPAPDNGVLTPEELFAFLHERRGFLDGVVISGGEPTLHADLFGFCGRIKAMGFPIKLDTNGSRPQVVQRLIQAGLVDYIAMDVKTAPTDYAAFICAHCCAETIPASIRIVMASGLPYEFRTTCVKPMVTESIIDEISRLIEGAGRYALQQVHTQQVLKPEFFKDPRQVCSDRELKTYQAIAAKRVKHCLIR